METAIFKIADFEGPLDLLLHLISKDKLSITDVSLAKITDQYFEYVEELKRENIDFSSEFIVVASELLYIKSKYLLPKREQEEELIENEQNLIDRLKEYRIIKLSAQKIGDRQFESKYLYFKIAENIKFKAKPVDPISKDKLTLVLLALAERKAIMRQPAEENLKEAIVKKPVTIFSKVKDILKKIKVNAKIKYKELFYGTRSEKVASFLALLELIKLNKIKLDNEGEEITVWERERYDKQ